MIADDIEANVAKLVVMRHSIRLDNSPDAEWCDKYSRPYDTPIASFDLPKIQTQKIIEHNIKCVVCSPFRRCLQTAAVACTILNISSIVIDKSIGETMSEIRRLGDDIIFEYLSMEASLSIINEYNTKLTISDIVGTTPRINETHKECSNRFLTAGIEYSKFAGKYGTTLLVTHGCGVGIISELTKKDVYSVDECGYVIIQTDKDGNMEMVDFDGVMIL